jgi:hypothetical protein
MDFLVLGISKQLQPSCSGDGVRQHERLTQFEFFPPTVVALRAASGLPYVDQRGSGLGDSKPDSLAPSGANENHSRE